MSFTLQRLNVVRIVETDAEKSKLLDKGFQLVEEAKKETQTQGNEDPKEEIQGNEDPKNDSTVKDDTKGKAGK